MKRVLALFTALNCCFLNDLSAQNNLNLSIRVLSAEDSTSSISGLSAFLKSNPGKGAYSNAKGLIEFDGLSPGSYEIVVHGLNYESLERKVQINQNLNLTIYIQERVMDLPAFVVRSNSLTGGKSGLKNLSGSAAYISPKDIEKFSYTDINRTLRSVPGVNLQEEDGFGLRPNIGLRGTGVERSSKITVMEDGILMAPAPYAAPAAYFFPTIGRMQAVEILKGSSQIKYGPYTTGGAINLISSQIPDKLSARVHLGAGSFGARNLHARVGDQKKNFAYLAETFQFSSDGFKELPRAQPTGFNKEDYMIKLRVNSDESAKFYQSLSLKLAQTIETSDETYLGLNATDFVANPYQRYAASQNDVMNTRQRQISLQHSIAIDDKLSILTAVYRSDFSRNWYKLDKLKDTLGNSYSLASLVNVDEASAQQDALAVLRGSSSDNYSLWLKANNREYYAQGVQTNIRYKWKTGQLKHNSDLGIRFHQDAVDRFQWEDEYIMDDGLLEQINSGIPGTESNRVEDAFAVAAFYQHSLNYKQLTLSPGLRYENISMARLDYGKTDPGRQGTNLSERSNQVDVFIPGMGMNYQLSTNMNLFGGIHKGFAPPGNTAGAEPETSINYELGACINTSSLNGQLVLFVNDYDNLLGSDLAAAGGAGTTEMFNGGSARSQGIEFQLAYDLLSGRNDQLSLPVNVVYTYTDAWFRSNFNSSFDAWGNVSSGDRLPYLAQNQFTLMLSLESRRFSCNISGRYSDAMRTIAGSGKIQADFATDAYFIVDASANYFLHPNISLFANAMNLTNEVYAVSQRPAGLRPGMPRAFNMGIKANF